MSDQLLGLLRIGLLGLLYLFFGRVLWAVWSEVRAPRTATSPTPHQVAAPAPASAPAAKAAPRRSQVTKLVLLEPRARKGDAFGLDQDLTIGRSTTCRLSLEDDTFVSQLHARVHHDGERAIVEDLGSTNGTYLNGNRLTAPHALSPGDRVSVGAAVLEAR